MIKNLKIVCDKTKIVTELKTLKCDITQNVKKEIKKKLYNKLFFFFYKIQTKIVT